MPGEIVRIGRDPDVNACNIFRSQVLFFNKIEDGIRGCKSTTTTGVFLKYNFICLRSFSELADYSIRIAFVLRNYENLSLKDIAGIMKCSEGTVKSHLARAVKKLQELLAGILSNNKKQEGE